MSAASKEHTGITDMCMILEVGGLNNRVGI